MKKMWCLYPVLFLAFVGGLASCAKTTDNDDNLSAEDMTGVSVALNGTVDDAANAVGGLQTLSGKTEGAANICGATVDTAQISTGVVTITFDGSNCGLVSRTGTITATLENYSSGTRWKDAGALLLLDFNNVKVTNTGSGAYYIINGRHKIKNVNGGLAWRIMDGLDVGSVAHKHVADSFSVKFDDGTERLWNVRRTRTFTNQNGVRAVTIQADTALNGVTYVDAWGTNRAGIVFTNAIYTAIVANSTCGFYKPVSGEYVHHVSNRTAAILFGVDENGNLQSSGCAYGMKITYTKGIVNKTRIIPYWY